MTPAEQCKANGHKCCALTLVRLVLGIIFFMHGAQMTLGWFGGYGLSVTAHFMTGMGLPIVVAYLVIFGELLGGLGLMFGVLSRFAAAGIAIIMVGAIVLVHFKNGFFLSMTPGQSNGYEYNLALFAMAMGIVIGGGGCISFDNFCCRKKEAEKGTAKDRAHKHQGDKVPPRKKPEDFTIKAQGMGDPKPV